MTQKDPNPMAESTSGLGGEVLVGAEDVLYCRTDEAGRTLNANATCVRLSGHEPGALLGKSQNVLRHPDMPRGIFHLLWKTIKADRTFGFYVKNRTKDDRFYWAFSVLHPVDGGFTVVRIKPSDKLHDTIARTYAEMLRAEADGASPEDSADILLRRLVDEGYPDYEAFQSMAMASEFVMRAKTLGQPLGAAETRFPLMGRAILEVQKETVDMLEAFKAIRTVPLNMRILASRLENAGGPIGAISVNYGSMLDEMKEWVLAFSDPQRGALKRIRDAILQGMLVTFAARVQDEAGQSLATQADSATPDGTVDLKKEAEQLFQQATALRAEAADLLRMVELEAGRLSRSVLDMKRYVTGLSSTRMMCKIESATLSDSGDALSGIVDQLDACQNEIEERLARISDLNGQIHSNTTILRSATEAAAA